MYNLQSIQTSVLRTFIECIMQYDFGRRQFTCKLKLRLLSETMPKNFAERNTFCFRGIKNEIVFLTPTLNNFHNLGDFGIPQYKSEAVTKILVSSAYIKGLQKGSQTLIEKPLMDKTNRRGPRVLPCGTPGDVVFSGDTFCFLIVK